MAEGLGTFGLGPQTLLQAVQNPLFNFNNSGFRPPMAGGQRISPTVPAAQSAVRSPVSSLANPQVVSPKPKAQSRGTNSGKSSVKPKTAGSLKPPPPLAAANAPLAAVQTSAGIPSTVAPAGLAMSAVTPSNAGGLGNYASIPDNAGGQIGVSQEAFDAVQNPMQGSLANAGGEGFMGGLTGVLGDKDLMTGISGLASLAGTGFDIYDKMWGNSAKTAKAQQNLLNQQAATNAQALKEHTDFRQGLVKSGLAANA